MSSSLNFTHTITKLPQTQDTDTDTCYSLKASVSLSGAIDQYITDPNIFAIQIFPMAMSPQQPLGRFSHVCDIADMQQYGTSYDKDMAYYRTSYIELILRSRQQAYDVLQTIRKQIRRLVAQYSTLQKADQAQQDQAVVERISDVP